MIGEIKERMSQKSSADLISIWRANDRMEWADDAFTAIKEILIERGEPLPDQVTYDQAKAKEQQVVRQMDGWEKLNKNPLNWKGRIGKLDWLLAGLLPLLATIPLMSPDNLDRIAEHIHPILIILIIGAIWYVVVASSIKRAHDCKRSGYYWLWLLVPVGQIIAILHFLFERGKWQENQEQ